MFPIPFRDHNPSERIPYATYAIIAINVLVFLLSVGMNELQTLSLYSRYAAIPALITQGDNFPSLITSMFMHAGWMHLIGNMLFLYIFGDNIEDTLGTFWFVIFYIISGLAATGLHIMLNPASTVPLVGASGAIAGVMGAYWLLFPRARVDVLLIFIIIVRTFSIPAFFLLAFWLGMQVIMGFATSVGGGGVAYWAHFGGFVAGVVMMLPVWLRKGGKHYWSVTEYHPPHPEARPMRYGRVPVIRRD